MNNKYSLTIVCIVSMFSFAVLAQDKEQDCLDGGCGAGGTTSKTTEIMSSPRHIKIPGVSTGIGNPNNTQHGRSKSSGKSDIHNFMTVPTTPKTN